MSAKFRLNWLQRCGALAFVLVIYASLMLPAQVERMRTGHWFIEHFIGYFIASAVICLGWRRRFLAAGVLTVTAIVLEALQALAPNRPPNLLSVLGGASGAWLAALVTEVLMVALNRGRPASG